MPINHRAELAGIKRFDQLVAYLRDRMGWPIDNGDFEELTFDYTAEELGIDARNAARIQEIKRLRPLSAQQPWGIFFVKFEPKKLPVVALRRILSQVALKKRASANSAERAAWAADDLLFVSNYGEGAERQISFAHFSQARDGHDLPTLKVLGWDNLDTALHLDAVAKELTEQLSWPADEGDAQAWRARWRGAFTLRHREVVTTSKELSIRLAELARAIRDRIRTAVAIESKAGPLTKLMEAFKATLVHDLDADGFADMYAQTIAYGLLSARIADPERKTADDFAAHMRTNPFLRELLETFLHAGGRRGKSGGPGIDFDELGVSEVVELLDAANMEAVVRDFGDRNPQEDPVIHFYELFLKEYDAKKRMQRGVFYTPRPVVSYIVRSVHELLRTEFGLQDGLADVTTWGEMAARNAEITIPDGVSADQDFVQILDPATGTGTFLVEVIQVIHTTLMAKWTGEGKHATQIDELWNAYVPKHLLTRLHGYELLMAPYAIAHLKIGLKLFETGYHFESDERARIYLTNALEPSASRQFLLDILPALAHEATAVNTVKRLVRFTAVVGNPPYAGHSLNNQLSSIVEKVYDYKRAYPDLQKPGQAKWLQDDYVKFLRFAEWQVEKCGVGIVGFITNHAWLDNPTFKGMRRHLLDTFSSISVVDLHGNANKQEMAPDGSVDANVFEIKQGVAVSIFRRLTTVLNANSCWIARSDILGSQEAKYQLLTAKSVLNLPSLLCRALSPELIFSNINADRKAEYEAFVSLPALMDRNGDPAPGIVTTHDDFAISFTREEQAEKVKALLATKTENEAREIFTLCSQSQWVYSDAKRALPKENWNDELVPILYRPFDRRWTVYSRYVAVHRRERVSRHMRVAENVGLISVRQVAEGVFNHALVSDSLVESRITISNKGIGFIFPLWLGPDWPELRRLPNLSPVALRRLAESTGLKAQLVQSREETTEGVSALWDGRADLLSNFGPRDVFDFVYAVLHSDIYRERYRDFLKSDFARIPLTPRRDLFCLLARLGSELIALHLMESPKLDHVITTYAGPRNPEIGRVSWSNDAVWLNAAAAKKGQPATLGTIGFHGVPEAVWNFYIGGYQVCEKWLKDRKGRTLSSDDTAHYQKIIVAVSETIRLMAEIDVTIEAHGGWPGAFSAGDSGAVSTEPLHESAIAPAAGATRFGVSRAEDELVYEPVAVPRRKAAEEPAPVYEARPTTRPNPVEAQATRSADALDRDDLVCLVRQLFTDGAERERSTAITEMARELGFQRTGSRIAGALHNALLMAVRRGIVVNDGTALKLASRSIEDYDRAFLKEQFLSSLGGRQWTERDDAIRSLARWLGFRRTGATIDDTARSLINGLLRENRLESEGSQIRRAS